MSNTVCIQPTSGAIHAYVPTIVVWCAVCSNVRADPRSQIYKESFNLEYLSLQSKFNAVEDLYLGCQGGCEDNYMG